MMEVGVSSHQHHPKDDDRLLVSMMEKGNVEEDILHQLQNKDVVRTTHTYARAKSTTTPLHVAAEKGYVSVIEKLIEKHHISPNTQEDEEGRTPLHIAVCNNNEGTRVCARA